MVISVFGLGFVGLTTALGLAEKGHKVFGFEVDSYKINSFSVGKVPFFEPNLDTYLKKHLNSNFFINPQISSSIKESQVIFYCVGTPYGINGEADLTFLLKAIDTTLTHISKSTFKTLVIKSTVPPHTSTLNIIPYVKAKGFDVGVNIGVSNNPEFLREGYCWDDFMSPDRIVIGVNDKKSENNLINLYSSFNAPIQVVNNSTSEYIKYLSNTLLATMISFANEMSIVGSKLEDIDIKNAFKILHMDKRWGNGTMKSYVYPGCGYGGYCLPKDTSAFYALSKNIGANSKLLENVIATNTNMPNFITDQIILNLINNQQKIGILGLSFKPNSDDVRDSPSYKIISTLKLKGYQNIIAHDPVAMSEFKKHYLFDSFANDLSELITNSDILVLLTSWPEYKELKKLTSKKILDFRYFL